MFQHTSSPLDATSFIDTPVPGSHKTGLEERHLHAAAPVKLSVIIPCYNEEMTLESCVESVLAIQDDQLALELIIVDDCSKDRSWDVAEVLAARIPGLVLVRHERNQGKGAALRTG